MQERVSSREVARAMDEVIELAGLKIPNRLHRMVAEQLGLHPTTVLRYHRQELESADVRVLECVRDIAARVRGGESLFVDDDEAGLLEHDEDGPGEYNVSVHELGRWFEKLRARLGNGSSSLLYQYVEDQTGIPVITVMRYHTGELRGAPSVILQSLKMLERVLVAGEPVVFRRGPGERDRLVHRRCVQVLLKEIEDLGLVTGSVSTEQLVSMRIGLDKEALGDLMSCDSWPFVAQEIFEKVRRLRDMSLYDPTRHYEVGDRIWFPDLGAGTVCEKLPKHRMLVSFDNGVQRTLREDIWVDPRVQYPLS